jgi:hypothetical protein
MVGGKRRFLFIEAGRHSPKSRFPGATISVRGIAQPSQYMKYLLEFFNLYISGILYLIAQTVGGTITGVLIRGRLGYDGALL